MTVVKVDTPDECCEGAKVYWVDVTGGHVKVGRHGEDAFIDWEDPEPFKVSLVEWRDSNPSGGGAGWVGERH